MKMLMTCLLSCAALFIGSSEVEATDFGFRSVQRVVVPHVQQVQVQKIVSPHVVQHVVVPQRVRVQQVVVPQHVRQRVVVRQNASRHPLLQRRQRTIIRQRSVVPNTSRLILPFSH